MTFFKWLGQKLRDESGQVGQGRRLVSRFASPFAARTREDISGRPTSTELQQLAVGPFDTAGEVSLPDLETQFPGLSAAVARIRGLRVGPFTAGREALANLRAAADPSAQLQAFRERFEQFTLPSIESALIARGLGRGGAVGQVAGEAATRGTEPILARAALAGERAEQTAINLEQAELAREQEVAQALLGAELGVAGAGQRLLEIQLRERARRRQAALDLLQLRLGEAQANLARGGARVGGGFGRTPSLFGGRVTGGGLPSFPGGVARGSNLSEAQIQAQAQAADLLAQQNLASFPTGATFITPGGPIRTTPSQPPRLSGAPFFTGT